MTRVLEKNLKKACSGVNKRKKKKKFPFVYFLCVANLDIIAHARFCKVRE